MPKLVLREGFRSVKVPSKDGGRGEGKRFHLSSWRHELQFTWQTVGVGGSVPVSTRKFVSF